MPLIFAIILVDVGFKLRRTSLAECFYFNKKISIVSWKKFHVSQLPTCLS